MHVSAKSIIVEVNELNDHVMVAIMFSENGWSVFKPSSILLRIKCYCGLSLISIGACSTNKDYLKLDWI